MALRHLVLTTFQKHFGEAVEAKEFGSKKNSPSVWVYRWDRHDFGIMSFTTVGFCDVPVPQMEPTHRLEFLFSAKRVPFEAAAKTLLTACASSQNDQLALRAGDTIGPVDLNLIDGSGPQRLLLTEPWEVPEATWIESAEGLHVQVLMIVPIVEAEYHFMRRYDLERFWTEFEKQQLDITDLERPVLSAAQALEFRQPR